MILNSNSLPNNLFNTDQIDKNKNKIDKIDKDKNVELNLTGSLKRF